MHYARTHVPYWTDEDIADLLTDRGVNPLLRSYLWAYSAGLDWFAALADASSSTIQEVLRAAYRQPLAPSDLARLWPTGPTFGGGYRLFAYGSLMFDDVLLSLIDRVPSKAPATVVGWQRTALPNAVYPGLLPGAASTRGVLIDDLSHMEWMLLDAFEDPAYTLEPVTLTDGQLGWAYVVKQVTDTNIVAWDESVFLERDLPKYLKQCARWRRRYQTATNIAPTA